MSVRCSAVRADGTFSLARYITSRACTMAASRLPSWVNSVGRPSFFDCQPYSSASRPSASSGSMVRIQGIVAPLLKRSVDGAAVDRDGAHLSHKVGRVIAGVKDHQLRAHIG